jgi:hypothetical protein
MGAIVMMAANGGINHEAGYGHEHDEKKGSERHYIPLPPAYEICKCPNCGLAAEDQNQSGHIGPEQPRRMRYHDGHPGDDMKEVFTKSFC